MQIISSIMDQAVATQILTHLNLAARPPPIAPARIREFAYDAA